MEGGIERALLDAQHVARNLLDTLGYGPAMLRFQRKRLQDEQIRHSLWKVDTVRVGHALPFRFYKEHTRSLVEVQGELGAWVATVQYSRVRASFSAAPGANKLAMRVPDISAYWGLPRYLRKNRAAKASHTSAGRYQLFPQPILHLRREFPPIVCHVKHIDRTPPFGIHQHDIDIAGAGREYRRQTV